MTHAASLLSRAARSGLSFTEATEPLTVPDSMAPVLLDGVRRQRIAGLLCAALADGSMRATPEFHEAAREAHLAGLRTSLACEATAVVTALTLSAAGVPCRVLKGIALAHLDYPDPSMRLFGDADVLVRRADLTAAIAALRGRSFERDQPPVRAWWERRYGKAVVLQAPGGSELDLHLTLTGGFYGLAIDDDDLFREPGETFNVAEQALQALPVAMRLLHAAYHVVLGGGSGLRAMRDVAQLIDVQPGAVADACMWARRWRGEAVLAAAIRSTWSALALPGSHPAVEWAAHLRQHPDDIARLATYR
ncbi:MAG: nucleotidyltransferase family protein, partial [Ilumatobacteraceae bacterium]